MKIGSIPIPASRSPYNYLKTFFYLIAVLDNPPSDLPLSSVAFLPLFAVLLIGKNSVQTRPVG